MGSNRNFKIVLLGAAGVGKTALAKRWIDDVSPNPCLQAEITPGAELFFKNKEIEHEGQAMQIQLWATAGADRYRSLSCMYYRHANACLVCYAVNDAQSLIRAGELIQEIEKSNKVDVAAIYLVGLKADLAQVQGLDAQAMADTHGITFLGKVSATKSPEVDSLFDNMIKLRCDKQDSVDNGALDSLRPIVFPPHNDTKPPTFFARYWPALLVGGLVLAAMIPIGYFIILPAVLAAASALAIPAAVSPFVPWIAGAFVSIAALAASAISGLMANLFQKTCCLELTVRDRVTIDHHSDSNLGSSSDAAVVRRLSNAAPPSSDNREERKPVSVQGLASNGLWVAQAEQWEEEEASPSSSPSGSPF